MGLTQQENIEGNKLIASFMGDTKRNLELDPNVSGYHYHDSFDWLMPVVEKIEMMNKDTGIMGVFTFFGLGRTRIQCYIKEGLSNEIDIFSY